MSQEKPLKCNVNPQYLKPFHNLENSLIKDYKSIPVLEARLCTQYDTKYLDNTFKGNIVDGQLEGSGKLKIRNLNHIRFPEGELKNKNKTCIIRNNMNGNKVIEAVGTFLNGMLHGPAKITFEDKSMLISNFVNGIPIGKLKNIIELKRIFILVYYILFRSKEIVEL